MFITVFLRKEFRDATSIRLALHDRYASKLREVDIAASVNFTDCGEDIDGCSFTGNILVGGVCVIVAVPLYLCLV